MKNKELIFISHSHKDEEITDKFHEFFKVRWPDKNFYYSPKPPENFTENYIKDCFEKCRASILGIIFLSDNSKISQPVQQEIGCLVGCKIERYYVAISESVNKPPGLEETHRTFPFHKYLTKPDEGFQTIAKEIEDKILFRNLPKKLQMRREFEQRFMEGGKSSHHYDYRNQCALLESFKCAEKEIKIMGENCLQPIHGGFETLKNFLQGGGSVNILIADYNAPEYNNRQELEGDKESKRIRADWIASVSNLVYLNQSKGPGTLEVKYTPEVQFGSLIIIDKWHLQHNIYDRTPLDDGEEGERGTYSGVDLYLKEHEKFEKLAGKFEKRWNNSKTKMLDLKSVDLKSVIPEKISV